jgi:putative endonuclease
MPNARQHLGAHGEDRAARWYLARGFVVVDRNWRVRGGEIDLVLQHGSQLVFCEVKTRTTDVFGSGLEAVTWAKQQRLRTLAHAWLAAHPSVAYRAIRFDVASIVGGVIEVAEGAF